MEYLTKAKKISNYQKQSRAWAFGIFSFIIFIISGITTFSFFYTFFPDVLAQTTLSPQASRVLSGASGFMLFDVATFIWLGFFLFSAETAEQRSISITATFSCFIASAIASSAYLILTSTGLFQMGQNAQNFVGIISIFVVVLGIIVNFGAVVMCTRFSKANKEAVRLSDRQDSVQEAIDTEMDELDAMIKVQVRENLKQASLELAEIRTEQIVEQVKRREKNGGEIGLEEILDNGAEAIKIAGETDPKN